ncbi:MAG: RNA 2',3'-cyclic phosphodiesterase [Methanoregula sp.]|nr:RNA 2',3'-cyclic phosphodiesterase [Methanoregula sp.]
MVRAFVALELSDEVRLRLSESQILLKGCSARMTWVEPGNIHITVKFLGEVKDIKIPDVKAALSSIAFEPFSISTGTITVNDPRRPFTVWCGIDDKGRGSDLLHRVDDVLVPLGFIREKRRFTPHATVARVKRFDPSLMEALKSLSGRTYGSCMVPGMKLKKSTLAPQGPVYEDLLEVVW